MRYYENYGRIQGIKFTEHLHLFIKLFIVKLDFSLKNKIAFFKTVVIFFISL